MKGCNENDPASTLADSILIDDSIIDNRLFNGDRLCFLRFAGKDLTLPLPDSSPISNSFALLYRRFRFYLFLLSVPPRIIYQLLIHRSGNKHTERLQLVPYFPIDVWLPWATTFIAQGLSHWISDFAVAHRPEKPAETALPAHFARRREYFAGEVLASAALHVSELGIPLWDSWPQDSDVADGRITKHELLKWSMKSGICLPFEQSHHGNDYRPYAIKLQRVTEEMPATFGTDILAFDVEALEWFTILVHIGYAAECKKGIEKTSDVTEHDPCHRQDKGDIGFDEAIEKVNYSTNDMAIANLLSQLGFPSERLVGEAQGKTFLKEICSFPLLEENLLKISKSNRLVTKVGEYVDVWISLVAGEHIRFLFEANEGWPETFDIELEKAWRLSGPSADNQKSSDSGPADETLTENSVISSLTEHCRESMRKLQTELEMERLRYQFAASGQRYNHLEQTLTFMGYSMETVRTELANWKSKGTEDLSLEWEPEIPYLEDGEMGGLEQSMSLLGLLREDLSSSIFKADLPVYLRRRSVQTRIIREVQELLQDRLGSGTEGPASFLTMMLAILSFPALSVDIEDEPGIDAGVERHNSGSIGIVFARGAQEVDHLNSDNVSSLSEIRMVLIPMGAPQRVSIVMRFVPDAGKGDTLSLRVLACLRRESVAMDMVFMWEWWRDSFSARLGGLSNWQEMHDLPFNRSHSTIGEILKEKSRINTRFGGMGDSMCTWPGWHPFRFEFCRFELESPGFILQFEEEKESVVSPIPVPGQGRNSIRMPGEKVVTVSYRFAYREQLKNCSMLIKEAVQNPELLQELSEVDVGIPRADLVLYHAEKLLSGSPGNVDRVLFLLETSAPALLSIKILEKFLQMLLDDEHISQNVERAYRTLRRYAFKLMMPSEENHSISALRKQQRLAFRHVYDNFVRTYWFSAHVACSFSSFLCGTTENIVQDLIVGETLLRMAFLYSNGFEAINSLGLLAFIQRLPWMSSNNALEPEEEGEPREIASGIGGNSKRDVRTSDIAMNRLRMKYYERAIGECRHPKSMNNLALMFHNGAPGVMRDMKRAKSLYERALSEDGNVEAMNNLANILCSDGAEIPRDIPRALHLYEEAVSVGHSENAAVNLANIYAEGKHGITSNPTRAKEILEEFIKTTGSAEAMYTYAVYLYNGNHGIAKDVEHAVRLYERSSAQGHSDSLYNLACILSRGDDGVNKNVDRAFDLFANAAFKKGNTEALNNLGVVLRDGNDAKRDERARNLYEYAMREGGSIEAMYNLGNMNRDGAGGLPQNFSRAVELYEKAVKASNPAAMGALAVLLSEGKGVAKDLDRAVHLSERAIERNIVVAMYNLGNWLIHGKNGIEVDIARGIHLMKRAADEGYANALYNMGCYYGEGKYGKEIDFKLARDCYEQAINAGQLPEAMNNLANLYFKGGPGLEADVQLGLELKERAIACGDVSTMVALALMFLNGSDGVEKDLCRGISLLETAIEEGSTVYLNPDEPKTDERQDVEAMYYLAINLLKPKGAEVDGKRAVSLLEKAIEEGNHEGALGSLAHTFRFGAVGVERDIEAAARYYERLIDEKNSITAMVDYASCLCSEESCIPRDPKRAILLLERAIEEGNNSTAMERLGEQLWTGDEDNRDLKRAVNLYEQALELNPNSVATQRLIPLYWLGGSGYDKNIRRAIELQEALVRKEDGRNSFQLGLLANLLLKEEEGVVPDPRRSLDLYEEAARLGDAGSLCIMAGYYEFGTCEWIDQDVGKAKALYEVVIADDNTPLGFKTIAGQGLERLNAEGPTDINSDAAFNRLSNNS